MGAGSGASVTEVGPARLGFHAHEGERSVLGQLDPQADGVGVGQLVRYPERELGEAPLLGLGWLHRHMGTGGPPEHEDGT